MVDTQALIEHLYAAFNRRDIDGALARMSDSVDWPRASEGGRVVGKDEIRAYWTRQWAEFDPYVEPVSIAGQEDGTTAVAVHQVVRTLGGEVLSDQIVSHVYTLADGLVERMEIGNGDAAFGKHTPA